MNRGVRRSLEVASGLGAMTTQKAEQVVRQLVHSGDETGDEVGERVEDLPERRGNHASIVALVRGETRRAVRAMGLATADEIEELQRQVGELRREVARLASVEPARRSAPAETVEAADEVEGVDPPRAPGRTRGAAGSRAASAAGAKKATARKGSPKKDTARSTSSRKTAAKRAETGRASASKRSAAKKSSAAGGARKKATSGKAPTGGTGGSPTDAADGGVAQRDGSEGSRGPEDTGLGSDVEETRD